MHAFSTCTTALEERPPPPSHCASYNITSITCMYIATTTTITTAQLRDNAYIQYMRHCFGKKDHQHLHLTVQVTILRPNTTTTTTTTTTAQITMHPFSICATALGKIPPLPPSHSASYNITANHHYHHRHHLDHHSTNYNACIQYMRHCFRKKNRPPVQVTVGLVRHQHPSDHRLCQGVHAHSGGRKRTTSASYRGSKLHRHHWRARCSKHL